MLKYVDTAITFSEIPDEITLCINISNCPCKCVNCHSSYLAEDIGESLDEDTLVDLMLDNKGITCIAFMGGDSEPERINALASFVSHHYAIKVAWYSGRQELSKDIDLRNFDFVKLGPYIEEFGPLNSKSTNQRMYKVQGGELVNMTNKFWKE